MSYTTDASYTEGYRTGYSQMLREMRDEAKPENNLGFVAAMRQRMAEDHGDTGALNDQELGDWWIGYYHGRSHARTGQPAPAATRDAIPEMLR